jgi:ribonuclease HI
MLRQSILKFEKKTIIKPFIQNLEYKLFFDGCSKGNPGLAGAGAVIYMNDVEIWSGTSFVGKYATNNEAEYTGIILGLEKAIDLNIKSLLVKGDSQLVINQMTGKYKCKSDSLLYFYTKAKNLEKKFENIEYNHVLRHFNKRADELANKALNDYIITDFIKKNKNFYNL